MLNIKSPDDLFLMYSAIWGGTLMVITLVGLVVARVTDNKAND